MRKNRPDVLYIAGPMTGIPEHNFPQFMKAARYLRRRGYAVINPAEMDIFVDKRKVTSEFCMARDFAAITGAYLAGLRVEIALLPRWFRSRGARHEVALAEMLKLKSVLYKEYK